MDVEQRTVEQIVNVVVGGQVAYQGRLTQIIIEAIEVELTPVALHTTYGSMVLWYKQIELSDDGAVIGQHQCIMAVVADNSVALFTRCRFFRCRFSCFRFYRSRFFRLPFFPLPLLPLPNLPLPLLP